MLTKKPASKPPTPWPPPTEATRKELTALTKMRRWKRENCKHGRKKRNSILDT